MSKLAIAPGATVLIRDEQWRVMQVNKTSSNDQALHVIGISELVRDQETIFLTQVEEKLVSLQVPL